MGRRACPSAEREPEDGLRPLAPPLGPTNAVAPPAPAVDMAASWRRVAPGRVGEEVDAPPYVGLELVPRAAITAGTPKG